MNFQDFIDTENEKIIWGKCTFVLAIPIIPWWLWWAIDTCTPNYKLTKLN